MRIVSIIVTVVALIFSFVAIAFMAVLGFVVAVVRQLFGQRPAATPAPQPPPAPGTATRAAGFARDDEVIDVVTTPVKD